MIPERLCLAQQPGQPPTIESAPSVQKRKPAEPVDDSHPAIPLEHDVPQSHVVAGIALKNAGNLDEAIAEFRESARINPDLAEAHSNLGEVLEDQGKLEDATADQPALAGDLIAANRYNAACSAALAGAGKGNDHAQLDDAAKARWRNKALDWLKADLAERAKQAETNQPRARRDVIQKLQHWKVDRDLAGVREAAALEKLPADQRRDWLALWSEVGTVLAEACAGPKH